MTLCLLPLAPLMQGPLPLVLVLVLPTVELSLSVPVLSTRFSAGLWWKSKTVRQVAAHKDLERSEGVEWVDQAVSLERVCAIPVTADLPWQMVL